MTKDNTSHTSPDSESIGKFLLQPIIQLKIAAWSAMWSAMFGLAIAVLFNFSLTNLSNSFVDVGHVDDETIARLYNLFEGVRMSALGLLLGQVMVAVIVSFMMTNRMLGAAVAFRQEIRALINRQYGRKVSLRNGDLFNDVAEDLNELSEQLRRDHKQESSGKETAPTHAVNE